MIAMSAVLFATFIAMEMSKESLFEYAMSKRTVDDVKAYYAAEAGVQLALLRIHLYNKAKTQFGKALQEGGQGQMLDMLWQMPLPWPPVPPEDSDISRVDKENMQEAATESFMDSEFLATITDEGSKIDINGLASPLEVIRNGIRLQLKNIFQAKVREDRDFLNRNPRFNEDELINALADWVDDDEQSLSGGNESSYYRDITSSEVKLPPNRPFRTANELKMVYNINDEIFEMLRDRITVYGMQVINVNHASPDVLMSLSPLMTEKAVNEIITRRSDPQLGPFATVETFVQFAATVGVNIVAKGEGALPLTVSDVSNFRIQSVGRARAAQREIVAIVYDFDRVSKDIYELLKKQETDSSVGNQGAQAEDPNTPSQTGNPVTDTGTNPTTKQSPPRILYWSEI